MFLSHKNSIEPNHYKVLSQFHNREVLVNSEGFKLVSNVCPHQKSLISTNSDKGLRVCPYHSWSFDIDGLPITSGKTSYYCKNITPLSTRAVFEWKNLLFDCPVFFDIDINFENLILMEERIDHVEADFKIIMDIFLDVDHIQSVHSGVYDLIGIDNTEVKWKYYENGSIQIVEQGALWISLYPYTMIEWQKGSLFVTVATPTTEPNHSTVSVFKYLDKNYLDQWQINQHVWETAWKQDQYQAKIITEFTENNLEPQKKHFRKFLKSNGIY